MSSHWVVSIYLFSFSYSKLSKGAKISIEGQLHKSTSIRCAKCQTKHQKIYYMRCVKSQPKKIPTFYNIVLLIEWYGSNVLKKIIILIHFLTSNFSLFSSLPPAHFPSQLLSISLLSSLHMLIVTTAKDEATVTPTRRQPP